MCCNGDGTAPGGGWVTGGGGGGGAAVAPEGPALASESAGGAHFGVHSFPALLLLILLGVGVGLYLRQHKVI